MSYQPPWSARHPFAFYSLFGGFLGVAMGLLIVWQGFGWVWAVAWAVPYAVASGLAMRVIDRLGHGR